MMHTAEPVPLRRTLAPVLITAAVAVMVGQILHVMRVYEPTLFRAEDAAASPYSPWPSKRPEPMPTHSDNDRSRWVTVRTLVDQGTYVIGHQEVDPQTGEFKNTGPVSEDGWKTIDKVMNPETHDFYSSKPPLLTTLVAGEYWLLKKALGWSIVEQPWEVVRTILLTINALPIAIYLVLLARLLERCGTTDWGRAFILTAACFGTFVTSFATTLNNHTVAACTALFGLYAAVRIWTGDGSRLQYLLAGFWAGFTAACELPATAYAVGLGLFLLLRSPLRALVFYLPAAVLPGLALVATNYAAFGTLDPRELAYAKFGGPWYEYPGSHWKPDPSKPPQGIDWAGLKETKAQYAFHVLIGHHGLFSLTPVFLLALVGIGVGLVRRGPQAGHEQAGAGPPLPPYVFLLTAFLTVIVIGFYIYGVGDRSRNYGGWTSGLRWLIWLTPFWLLTMLPAADWLAGRRWGRGLACALLAVSVLSASYPTWNPWRHPWLYNLLEYRNQIHY
jgi:hypothetical protein